MPTTGLSNSPWSPPAILCYNGKLMHVLVYIVHGGQMPRSYGYVQYFRISLAGNLALVASTVQHGKLEPWTHGRQLAHVMLAATALLL